MIRFPRSAILLTAACGIVAWAAACGDGATEPPAPLPDPPRATTVTVTPATAELTALGATVQLRAEVRDQNGQVMAGAAVSWSSSDAAVATVDGSGLVTAVGNGTATITATAGAVSGSATVTVGQVVGAVTVSPAADTLVEADTLRLSAEATDANSHAVAGAEFAWASSDTAVAVVDDSGLVTGVAAGEVVVTATSSGVTGSAELTVVAPAPTTVAVTPDTLKLMAIGQTAQLAAEVLDQAGRAMAGVAVSWSSGDTAVAAVDSAGLVTAVGPGGTTVTATAGEASGTALVTVMQSAGSVIVSPAADTIAPGDTLRLVAEAFDGNGHPVEGAELAWSSSDVSVAAVDASGLVRGVREGMATVTAASGSAQGTAEITVANPDRAALVALYEATDGPNWINSDNWLTDASLGEWYGVSANSGGSVVGLDLDENNLTGPIPPEIANLANLQQLYLPSNDLSGPIPTELRNLVNLEFLNFWGNALSGPIPTALGSLTNLEWLDLGYNDLSGPIPTELSNLANLTGLHLGDNSLNGPIPTELGSLANLEWLSLDGNSLSGPIPQSFLRLDRLRGFYIVGKQSLCVPGTSAFVAWLRGIEDWDDSESFCNATDVAALKLLYELTRGTAWTESDGWSGDGAVEKWHGVSADSLGRVTILDLSRNGLSGRLPGTLGDLARMTDLRIADNTGLSGRLPLSLALLALETLHYSGTGLCAPVDTSFRDWLSAIPSHEGTGAECPPLSDREVLEALYAATGGPDWTRNENWLTDAPLGEWYGVEVDDQGAVVELGFVANGLTGRIPPELGGLANLRSLDLYRDGLTGPIPPELADLANLQVLSLGENDLTGPIPTELGGLANLWSLSLHENDLTGPIPTELGNLDLWELNLTANRLAGRIPAELGSLADLSTLYLGRNELTGPIPTELGNLAHLWSLNLAANRLTGGIPPELGSLADLSTLYLGDNELEGPVPPEFGGLMRLGSLALQGNADLSGALPASLTNLADLETLQTGGTGLCAPSDADFLEWLERVPNRRVASCEGEPAMAYLVQAAQSREFPVPLVAGEEALLRVFVTAGRDNDERLPPVRASFYRNGALAHVADIAGKPSPIPTEVDEGSLVASANAVVPADVVRPGLEMVVEVDPDGTLDAGVGVAGRIPATGRAAVDVRAMPVFDLTLVPFLWTEDPDSAVLESVGGMAADPEGHELLELTRTVLPVGELTVAAHEPVLSSSNDAYDLIDQTGAIRVMEGGTGYYMGAMSGSVTGAAGLGGGLASFAVPDAFLIGHEFGHNFGLPHAPCGGAGNPDPAYPTPDGTIGAWGYDFERGVLVPPTTTDIMGYCPDDAWISDYFFTKALHVRLANEAVSAAAVVAHPSPSLLLWGGVDSVAVPYLEPAFVVDAPTALPAAAGNHRLVGRSASGSELFSLSFAMPETADGDGSSSFAFALPVRPGWEDSLASITLSGPGGSVTLDGESDVPMAILRNPRSGQVRGILRDLPPATQAAMDAVGQAAGPGLEVLFSRGIPGAEAWRR